MATRRRGDTETRRQSAGKAVAASPRPRVSASSSIAPVRSRGEAPSPFQVRLAVSRQAARMGGDSAVLANPLPGRYGLKGYQPTRPVAGDYRSARVAANEDRSYSTKSGDARAWFDREALIAECRAHYGDNALFRGLVECMASCVVGNGFALQLLSSDESWNATGEELWAEYWRSPEVRGMWSGADLERQTCVELVLAGDLAYLKLPTGQLQAIEAERISNGDGRTGLKVDATGAVQAYYIQDYSTSGALSRATQKEVPAKSAIFVARRDRFSSSRGMPALVPALPMIHRINDVCDGNALAWQLISRLVLKRTMSQSAADAWNNSRADGSASADSTRFDLSRRIMDLGWGVMFNAEPGENIEGIERNIPQQNFTDSLRAFLRVVGLPLGMPLELVLLDASQSNLSSMRGIYEQAWINFRRWQQTISAQFLAPVLAWKLDHFVRQGRLKPPPEGLARVKSSWIAQPFPWLEQLKEAQAWASKLDRTLATHGLALKSLGLDPDLVAAQREREVRKAIELAKTISADTGEKVPWQMFCGLAAPGTSGIGVLGETPKPPQGPSDGSDKSDASDKSDKEQSDES